MASDMNNRTIPGATTRGGRTRAFTIVEMIVVVVILGVLAAAMGPRVAVFLGRGVRGTAEEVAGVMSAAARRDTFTSQRVAVEGDGEGGRVRLVVFDPASGEWREDNLVPAADLGSARLDRVMLDTASLDPANWRVEFPQSQPRGTLTVVVSDAAGRETFVVRLGARASRAVVTPGERGLHDDGAGVIDLDATGRGDQAW